MRRLMLCALLVVGCKNDAAKDKEIAALRSQLAAKNSPPTPAPSLGAVQPVAEESAAAAPDPELTPQAKLARDILVARRTDANALTKFLAEAAKPENRQITYAHLTKNAARYFGRPWTARARVLEIHEHDGYTTGRIGLSDYRDEAVYFAIPGIGETDFVAGSLVEVAGYLAGTETYQSQAGWNITIPSLMVFSMTKPGGLRKPVKVARAASDDE